MEQNKMYWKNGFYDTYQEGSIEITKEYWLELLSEQSNGKEITTNKEGYPIAVNHVETLEEVKYKVITRIKEFDKSDNINSFSLRGNSIWLDKDLRSSIINTVNIKIKKGIKESSIWYKDKEYILRCEDIISMLEDVSIYADSCNSATSKHISNIKEMIDINDIETYNYRLNYPIKLAFEF